MTLAQVEAWAVLHQRRRQHDQRALVNLIRLAMAGDQADIDRAFAKPVSAADQARADAETLHAYNLEPDDVSR